MRSILSIIVVFLIISSVLAIPTNVQKFVEFQSKFNKHYESKQERAHRLQVFTANLALINKLNQEEGSEVYGVTKFSDLTPAEFKKHYLMNVPLNKPHGPVYNAKAPAAIPTTWDWGINKTGIVTPVKNQEQCGSCWAFSATETVESDWALKGHTEVVLAPQQIVDCDKIDQGCNGGWPYDAYKYVISAGGLEPEVDYPYTGVNGRCTFKAADVAAKISAWSYVSQSASTELTTMLNFVAATGPVSVCVDASTWQFYNGGVIQKNCGDEIDHCVQVTGFSVVSGIPVWNVRNSWGTDWGVNGYLYVKRGMNLCDIATVVTTTQSQ